jgi:DNA-binding response OmpR family regulator
MHAVVGVELSLKGYEKMSDDQSVLYVEDEPLLRELAAIILEDAGFEVVMAENGRAAFEALDEDGSPFCAMVTDINLGAGPDGWAVAKRGRELNPALPVIYLTGASGHQWRAQGVPKSRLITKPFKPGEILQALRALLGSAASHCSTS